MLILNRDVETKLLRFPQKSKGKHYENTRKRDVDAEGEEEKIQTKEQNEECGVQRERLGVQKEPGTQHNLGAMGAQAL